MQRVGVDLVEVGRIRAALQRHGDRFLRRVFTAAECDYCRGRAPALAARWAAKEAAAKALGWGIGEIRWLDIEVVNDERGAPTLALHGEALTRASALGLRAWAVSLSHTNEHAIAFVVLSSD